MGIWTLLLQAHTIQPSPLLGTEPFTVAPPHTHSVLTISSTGMRISSCVLKHLCLFSPALVLDVVQKKNIESVVKIDPCAISHWGYSLRSENPVL